MSREDSNGNQVFFSKYYTNKLYIKKLSVIITTQKKRKKRKCVQSKTIDCDVI